MELDTIRKNLDAPPCRSHGSKSLTPAAVLLPLMKRDGEVRILFTKRSQSVRVHKGQISFPGGVREESDQDLLATALREAHEEIGLLPADVDVLGSVGPVETVTSGFLVHTFVGQIPHPYPFRLCDREVARILTVPLSFIADTANWHRSSSRVNGNVFEWFFIPCGKHVIWGATARILGIFLRLNGIHVGWNEENDDRIRGKAV